MKTRDGRDINVLTCPACGVHYSTRSGKCPVCGNPAGNGHLAAIAPDPHAGTQDAATTARTGSEAAMQAEVEGWLRFHGYWPRSPKYLDGTRPPRGWYIHVHQCQGNPIVLDLLILDFARGWYEIELKTERGRASCEQVAILGAEPEHSILCRYAQDAIDAIRQRFEMA